MTVDTSATLRWPRSVGGEVAALFAADDGSCEPTKFSMLPDASDSGDEGVRGVVHVGFVPTTSLWLDGILRGVVGRLDDSGDDERPDTTGGGIMPFD